MRTWQVAAVSLALAACPPPPPAAPTPPVADPPPPPPTTTSSTVTTAPADAAPAAPKSALAPPQPTLRLPKNFVPIGYNARLTIDPAKPTFDGMIEIAGTVSERSSVIWLHGRHLTFRKATASITPQDPLATPHGISSTLTVTPHGDDLLELRADPPLDAGTWYLELRYSGEIDRVNTTGMFSETVAGASYVYSQFEAVYARRVFPCVDEPDNKVPWQLSLQVPKSLVAVSNTPIAEDVDLMDGTKLVTFARTKPLPSYLVAFGVGPFEIVDAGKTKSGTPVRMITLKGRAKDAAWAAKTTPRALELLEDWFAIPYPYEKLDLLTIPLTVGFGAMENAGLVTYTERGMLFDPAKGSVSRKRSTFSTIAHELAHQWFGDLVTTAWWDDIWLNEGFADWMQSKIIAGFEPAWHEELGELGGRNWALASDSLVSARRVRQPIEKIDDILNVFDGITYDKGASVLRMFERYVGAETFQRGVRDYLKARAFGNATSADFIAAISAAAGKDLAPAFATFLDQGGEPQLDAAIACDHNGPRVELAQQRYVPPGAAPPPPGKPWIFPVCVAYDNAGKRAEACTLLDQPKASLALDTKTCPRWVMPNVDGRGYYRLHPTAAQVIALRDEAWPQLTWTERRAVFFDVADAVHHTHELPLPLALSLVPRMLVGGDRFTIGDALSLPLGLDRLVADDQRPKYEAWLRGLFGPGATQLGAMPKPTDDLDAEASRQSLFWAAAHHGRDPELVKRAIELAAKWRELPQAMRNSILDVAVDENADAFDRAMADVKREPDRVLRGELLGALGDVRDAKRREAVLALVLDPALDIRESIGLVYGGPTEATRAAAEKFVRDHEAELVKRLPVDETTGGAASLAYVFTGACDAKRRDELVDYVTKHFAAMPGGERIIKQAIEGMDQCIAGRAVLEPEIRAWLGGYKLPRPDAKKDAKPASGGGGKKAKKSR